MENASKALLMAAGVLIGVLILSLAVYLFVSFGTASAELHKQKEQDQINQFNAQFTSYENKDDVTIYDVVSVARLASENNIYYEFEKGNNYTDSDFYIKVTLNGNSNGIEKGDNHTGDTDYEALISNEINSINYATAPDLPKYTCTVTISPKTQRVCKVEFNKKTN